MFRADTDVHCTLGEAYLGAALTGIPSPGTQRTRPRSEFDKDPSIPGLQGLKRAWESFAEESFNRALSLRPGYLPALVGLGSAAYSRGLRYKAGQSVYSIADVPPELWVVVGRGQRIRLSPPHLSKPQSSSKQDGGKGSSRFWIRADTFDAFRERGLESKRSSHRLASSFSRALNPTAQALLSGSADWQTLEATSKEYYLRAATALLRSPIRGFGASTRFSRRTGDETGAAIMRGVWVHKKATPIGWRQGSDFTSSVAIAWLHVACRRWAKALRECPVSVEARKNLGCSLLALVRQTSLLPPLAQCVTTGWFSSGSPASSFAVAAGCCGSEP